MRDGRDLSLFLVGINGLFGEFINHRGFSHYETTGNGGKHLATFAARLNGNFPLSSHDKKDALYCFECITDDDDDAERIPFQEPR